MAEGDLSDFATDITNSPDAGIVAGGGGEYSIPDPGFSSVGPWASDRGGYSFPGGSVGDYAGKVSGEGGGAWYNRLGEGLMKEVTGSPLKAFSTALGFGGTGMGLANQFKMSGQAARNEKFIQQSQERANAAAAPAVAAGTADINRAQAGKLQPAMEASIEQWVQRAKADMRGRYAAMGRGNSSDLQGEEARIDQLALSMRAQLLQSEEQVGGQLLQTGVNANQAGAQTATHQQGILQNLIAAADAQLGKLTANA